MVNCRVQETEDEAIQNCKGSIPVTIDVLDAGYERDQLFQRTLKNL